MVSVLKQIKRVPKTGKQQTAKPLGKTKQTARKSTGGRNIARAREQLVQMAASSTGTSRQLSIGQRMGGRIPAASTAATAGSRSSSSSSSAASRATMTRALEPTQAEMRAAETAAIAAATRTGGVGTSTSNTSTRRTSVLVSGPNKERREVAVEGASAVAGVSVAGPFDGAVAGAAADNMRAGTRTTSTRMEDDDRPRQPPAERGGDDADDEDADLGNLGGGMDDDDDDDVGAEAEAEETKEAAETEAEETQQNVAASRSTSGNGQVMVIFQQQGDRPDRRLVLGLHQKFSTVYREIAKLDRRVPGTFKFLLDGMRILHRHTPAELELDKEDEEDEDGIRTIDVVENQEGGGHVYVY